MTCFNFGGNKGLKSEKSMRQKLQSVEENNVRIPTLKKRIAVVFGEHSPEYSVSLQSAYAVICHLDSFRYSAVLIGISKEGDWFLYHGNIEKILEDTWCNANDCTPVCVSQNRSTASLMVMHSCGMEKISVDAVFPVLHGRNGEDGTVQGVFALAGIPVVGCGLLASALCMDKDRAHKLVSAAGIAVPASFAFDKRMEHETIYQKASELGYPVFVKPVKAGSSYGLSMVSDQSGLLAAVALAFQYDDCVIMEECICGIEVGCAVVGNHELTVGEVDEIELTDGFF